MLPFARLAFAATALLAAPAAAQSPTLTIYTYDSFAGEYGPGPQLKAGFEAQCGCTVDFVATESSLSSLRRLQLEGETTTADVVLGLDIATAGEARATGLFAPHRLTLPPLLLPGTWDDPDFVPFDYGYFAFVYRTDRVPSPPASFEDLIALPDNFKIVIEDPRSDTPGLGLVLWIQAAYGERAPEIWAGLKPHVLTVARSWSDAYGLFLRGEADMVLSYTTSPGYHAVAENDAGFAYAAFAEGHYPQVEVGGIVASSDSQALAAEFLQYLVSPEAQAIIPVTNWMYPVAVPATPLPEPLQNGMTPAKVLQLEEGAIDANKGQWIADALAALD